MSALQLFTNNAVSLLATPVSASSLSLSVLAGHGDLFPQPTLPGEYFLVTLEDQAATSREIIKVVARTGDSFTVERAQEGTTARAWGASIGNDTLVDHRITAYTMRRAMELPEASLSGLTDVDLTVPPTIGQTIQWNGTNWIAATGSSFTPGSIDAFTDVDTTSVSPTVGQALVWNGTNWSPATISSGTGTAWIYGENTGPINIDPGWTLPISTVTYSNDNRGFKFYVTVQMQSNGLSQTFEMLATVGGNITANTEDVDWVKYGRVGYSFLGNVQVVLNKPTNQLIVRWQNLEANQVRVVSTRIQHTI